jgi:hypothetical protein
MIADEAGAAARLDAGELDLRVVVEGMPETLLPNASANKAFPRSFDQWFELRFHWRKKRGSLVKRIRGFDWKPLPCGGIEQALIGAVKETLPRVFATGKQSGCELKRIGRPERVQPQETFGTVNERFYWQDSNPLILQGLQSCFGPIQIYPRQETRPMSASHGGCQFSGCSPPGDHWAVLAEFVFSLVGVCFPGQQGYDGGAVPVAYHPVALSSATA